MQTKLHKTMRLLFIGDSITDCGRGADPEGVGSGYVRIIRDYLRARDPASAPQVINRGISGHKVTDLHNRWQTDVIDLAPHVCSIMIGVNDVWHSYTPGLEGVGLDEYVAIYRGNLKQLTETLPECDVILCEPTVIWEPQDVRANPQLEGYVKAVHDLGREFKVRKVIETHKAFEEARRRGPDIDWAPDGVHPSSSGHMLIARTWLKALDLL